MQYLDARDIGYARTTHSPAYTAEEVAEAEHMPSRRITKTVVCRDESGYFMVAVPADSYVDLDVLRTAIGARNVFVADESELYRLFPEAEVGAMPPLGVLFGMRVYLDREIANREFLAFNAGTHRDTVHMRVSDFLHIVKPIIGDFGDFRKRIHNETLAEAFVKR
jgi:Ala-tRNA(Pro) deacylase